MITLYNEETCYWMFMFKQALHKYENLKECCENTLNKITDDETFCIAENELMSMWYQERGFTKEDYEYAVACGCEYLSDNIFSL